MAEGRVGNRNTLEQDVLAAAAGSVEVRSAVRHPAGSADADIVRFGLHGREPQTLERLALQLRLTRERVRQIQQEALLKLKRGIARRGVDRDALF